MPPFLYGKQSILRGNVRIISALDALYTRNVKKIRKKLGKNLVEPNKSSTFATANEKYNISRKAFGVLTERLGNGLQNRVERFDSARHLTKRKSFQKKGFLFCFPQFLFLFCISSLPNPFTALSFFQTAPFEHLEFTVYKLNKCCITGEKQKKNSAN